MAAGHIHGDKQRAMRANTQANLAARVGSHRRQAPAKALLKHAQSRPKKRQE
jgi:hypothetical protein